MSELQFAKQFLTTLDNKTTKYQPDHVFDPKTTQLRIPYTLPKLSHPPHPNPPSSIRPPTPPPGAEPIQTTPSVNLTLKSSRNPNMSLTLPSLPYSTPVSTIKDSIQSHLGGPTVLKSTDKIKILLNKKPIPSSKKTLGDAFQGNEDVEGKDDVALSVMIMGGAPDPPQGPAEIPPPPADAAPPAAGGEGDTSTAAAAVAASAPESEKAQAEADKMEGVEQQQPQAGGWQDEVSQPAFWDDLQGFLQQRLKDEEGGKKLRDVMEKAWRADSVKIAT